LHLAFQQHRSL
jgi:hypothetical protein